MSNLKRIVFIILVESMLSGCTTTPDSGVVNFVENVKKTSAGYAEKVPEIVQIKPVKFDTAGIRDPFEKITLKIPENEKIIQVKAGPNPERVREPLEGYPLESLAMVGTLEREGKFFALLKDRTGIVHIAGIGNYVGENSGKIEVINETEVILTELMPDGKGGWRDHKARIPFVVVTEKEAASMGKGAPTIDQGAIPSDGGTTTQDRTGPTQRRGRGE